MTCWRRVRGWQEAGIGQPIHFSLLDWLARYGRLIGRGLSWMAVLSGQFWGRQTGPNPTDRAKLGSKRHLICDGRGQFHSPFNSPRPTATTRSKRFDRLTPSPACRESGDAHGIVRTAYWATVVMTRSQFGKVCVPAISSPF